MKTLEARVLKAKVQGIPGPRVVVIAQLWSKPDTEVVLQVEDVKELVSQLEAAEEELKEQIRKETDRRYLERHQMS